MGYVKGTVYRGDATFVLALATLPLGPRLTKVGRRILKVPWDVDAIAMMLKKLEAGPSGMGEFGQQVYDYAAQKLRSGDLPGLVSFVGDCTPRGRPKDYFDRASVCSFTTLDSIADLSGTHQSQPITYDMNTSKSTGREYPQLLPRSSTPSQKSGRYIPLGIQAASRSFTRDRGNSGTFSPPLRRDLVVYERRHPARHDIELKITCEYATATQQSPRDFMTVIGFFEGAIYQERIWVLILTPTLSTRV